MFYYCQRSVPKTHVIRFSMKEKHDHRMYSNSGRIRCVASLFYFMFLFEKKCCSCIRLDKKAGEWLTDWLATPNKMETLLALSSAEHKRIICNTLNLIYCSRFVSTYYGWGPLQNWNGSKTRQSHVYEIARINNRKYCLGRYNSPAKIWSGFLLPDAWYLHSCSVLGLQTNLERYTFFLILYSIYYTSRRNYLLRLQLWFFFLYLYISFLSFLRDWGPWSWIFFTKSFYCARFCTECNLKAL